MEFPRLMKALAEADYAALRRRLGALHEMWSENDPTEVRYCWVTSRIATSWPGQPIDPTECRVIGQCRIDFPGKGMGEWRDCKRGYFYPQNDTHCPCQEICREIDEVLDSGKA